ncbi:MAG: nitrous oxide reductase family maturation protein NosD [Rhodanobacter sp.]
MKTQGNRTCALLFLVASWAMSPMAHADDGLERAIATAVAGATLSVPPGIHHVHLLLNKPITLQGQPGAVLDGDGNGDVVRITAPGVTVRDLTIRHSGDDLTAMNAGVFVEGKAAGATIVNNRMENILFGVYLDGAAGVRVIHNTITGIATLRVADRGDGIHLWNDTGCTIEANDVSATRDGIYDYVSHDDFIVGNRIHGVQYGVHQMYAQRETLRDNISFDNVAGMALMSSSHLRVDGNHIFNDSSYGILFNYDTYNDIRGNEIRGITGELDADGKVIDGAEGKAMFVYNSEFNEIHGNLITNSPIGIHVTAGSQDNKVYGNAFLNNQVQVKYVQNVAEEWSLNGSGNYWSDYLGWDLNGDGLGDVPYRPNDGVDVLLWKYPDARMLMSSPSILLLRYVQRSFPVFTPPNIQDSHPLMRLPAPWSERVDAKRH